MFVCISVCLNHYSKLLNQSYLKVCNSFWFHTILVFKLHMKIELTYLLSTYASIPQIVVSFNHNQFPWFFQDFKDNTVWISEFIRFGYILLSLWNRTYTNVLFITFITLHFYFFNKIHNSSINIQLCYTDWWNVKVCFCYDY